ncbi:hypothetical protein Q1695_009781 [Nippostrongylus brasiliensis]|nr:hypothetical protein Q1695_009781 [Nippostrongylus brasiliensis]
MYVCPSTTPIGDEERDQFLSTHNAFRKEIADGTAVQFGGQLVGSQQMFELKYSCELERIAHMNTAHCFKIFQPAGKSMNLYVYPKSAGKISKEDLISLAMSSWYEPIMEAAIDDNATFDNRRLEPFANMVYYKSLQIGCSYTDCRMNPHSRSQVVACVYSSAPQLYTSLYVPGPSGCTSNDDCSIELPQSKCNIVGPVAGLCTPGALVFPNKTSPAPVTSTTTTSTTAITTITTPPTIAEVPTEVPATDNMTDNVRDMIVDMHNNLRSLLAQGRADAGSGSNIDICKPSQNMYRMKYDRSLEEEAQLFADQCPDTDLGSPVSSRPLSGENMKVISSYNISVSSAFVSAVQSWWEESSLFNPKLGTRFAFNYQNRTVSPLDFTQMAWAKTYRVGCAVQRCWYGRVIVCRYRPRGNILGETIYEVGPTCGACEGSCSGNNGLCNPPSY